MATPCSVNANGQTVECLRLLNRSQFVTSSPPLVIMFFSSTIIFLLRGYPAGRIISVAIAFLFELPLTSPHAKVQSVR